MPHLPSLAKRSLTCNPATMYRSLAACITTFASLAMGGSAYGATLGTPQVLSQPHLPFEATIGVSDIDVSSFSVSLASASFTAALNDEKGNGVFLNLNAVAQTQQLDTNLINDSSDTLLARQSTTTHCPAGQPATATVTIVIANDDAIDRESQPDKPSYLVQANDNLWSMAAVLAESNDLKCLSVMYDIYKQHPVAFIDGHMKLLKRNAQLTLPEYEHLPTQQSLQTALEAQRDAVSDLHANSHNTITASLTVLAGPETMKI